MPVCMTDIAVLQIRYAFEGASKLGWGGRYGAYAVGTNEAGALAVPRGKGQESQPRPWPYPRRRHAAQSARPVLPRSGGVEVVPSEMCFLL